MVVVSYSEGFADLDTGARVFHRCWKPQEPRIAVVGIHGYTVHSGFYMHVGSALASHGFAVCMPDVRGHGKTAASESDRGYVDSFNYFLTDLESFSKHVLKELGVERLVLLGHSMGGLVVLYYVAKYGRVGDAVVAIAPAILIPISTSAYIAAAIASKLTPRKRVRLPFTEEQIKRAMENQDREALKHIKDPELALRSTTIRLLYEIWKASREFWKYAKNIRIPLLLVHGEKDDIIPVEASRKAYNAVSSKMKELKLYPQMGHGVLSEVGWREAVKHIANWIESVLQENHG